jgi:DNA-binding IclR family transcriptional regulator
MGSATERSFALLQFVARAGQPVAVAELTQRIGLPKATMHRLVEWFVAQGFFVRLAGRKQVAVGPRLVGLAFDILRASWQAAPRRAALEALANETGETCNIGTLDGTEIVYLDRVEAAHWPLRLHFDVGSRVPLHCSAIGKLFLAYLPERQRQGLLRGLALARRTERTITDRARLDGELARIRADGVAFDDQEFIAGVVCVAVPILDDKGAIRAAVALQGPEARLSIAAARGHVPRLRRTARRIAQSLAADSLAADGLVADALPTTQPT